MLIQIVRISILPRQPFPENAVPLSLENRECKVVDQVGASLVDD